MVFSDGTESSNRYDRVLEPERLDPNTSYAHILEMAGPVATVLDVGCNTGYLGHMFIRGGSQVAGIDNDEAALEKAREVGIDARYADLDTTSLESVFPGQSFDLIVFADVLEHLKRPDAVLVRARTLLNPDGRVIASIPNVAHGNVRLDLLLGRFEYTVLGLLENTHLRFFTGDTIEQLFADAGFAIEAVGRVTSPVDSDRIEGAAEALGLPLGARDLLSLLSSESSETFQYVVRARPLADGSLASSTSFWELGDRDRPVSDTPSYICVDEVPNVIADMRKVITHYEALLAERQEYLATVIRDKDELIGGLEASVAEIRAYFENVVEHREGLIACLEKDLEGARAAIEDLRLKLDQGQRRFESLTLPTVTVIVVNWNGAALLPACLASMQDQDYPPERYRVVVVDNGSTDDSVASVRRDFPGVTVLEAKENLGFAGGNNLAIEATEGDYVALLNNDAVAEPGWLRRMVELAEADPKIGAVSSKILLLHDRLPVSVDVDGSFVPGQHDPRRLSVQIAEAALVDGNAVGIEFITGAFGREENAAGPFRWITERATLRVPIADPSAGEAVLRVLPTPFPSGSQPRLTFRVGMDTIASLAVPAVEPVDIRIPLSPGRLVPLIQNAGSVVLPDGAGSDRGSIVVGTTAFYDTDHGQFDAVEEVPAFCGAAVLLRRSALEEVGAFDGSFFMYYEDTDLSLRMRQHGWRLVYNPEARVRHHHSATAVEWSPRFCYYTERNRLLMLLKNERPRLFLKEWARYTARLARPRETPENRKRFMLVQRSLLRHVPQAVAARRAARERAAGSRLGFKEYSE
jgi:GT2 family glycosyltransferase/2-polyprenyl-3-methyl-5-hydroxy-6-metoxy-1,4-benzoquinol methylase